MHDLRRKQFVRNHDQGANQRIEVRFEHVAEMGADGNDHVADIVQSFLQAFSRSFRNESLVRLNSEV